MELRIRVPGEHGVGAGDRVDWVIGPSNAPHKLHVWLPDSMQGRTQDAHADRRGAERNVAQLERGRARAARDPGQRTAPVVAASAAAAAPAVAAANAANALARSRRRSRSRRARSRRARSRRARSRRARSRRARSRRARSRRARSRRARAAAPAKRRRYWEDDDSEDEDEPEVGSQPPAAKAPRTDPEPGSSLRVRVTRQPDGELRAVRQAPPPWDRDEGEGYWIPKTRPELELCAEMANYPPERAAQESDKLLRDTLRKMPWRRKLAYAIFTNKNWAADHRGWKRTLRIAEHLAHPQRRHCPNVVRGCCVPLEELRLIAQLWPTDGDGERKSGAAWRIALVIHSRAGLNDVAQMQRAINFQLRAWEVPVTATNVPAWLSVGHTRNTGLPPLRQPLPDIEAWMRQWFTQRGGGAQTFPDLITAARLAGFIPHRTTEFKEQCTKMLCKIPRRGAAGEAMVQLAPPGVAPVHPTPAPAPAPAPAPRRLPRRLPSRLPCRLPRPAPVPAASPAANLGQTPPGWPRPPPPPPR